MLRRFWIWLFGKRDPLSMYPARRRGVLSCATVKDEDETPSWARRFGYAGGGPSDSRDFSAVDLGPEFRPGGVERAEERIEIGDLLRKIEDFEDGDINELGIKEDKRGIGK